MYETNMVEIDGFNLGQVEDDSWGYDKYVYTFTTFVGEYNEEDTDED